MKLYTYVINSPGFPKRNDFNNFSVWCEWEDAEEVPYLKSLCESNTEYESKIITPYKQGKETYYPIPSVFDLPERCYYFIKVSIQIGTVNLLEGYVSTSDSEVVSITIWPSKESDVEVTLYRSDRLVAEDDNPIAMRQLSSALGLSYIKEIIYSSEYFLLGKYQVKGVLKFK